MGRQPGALNVFTHFLRQGLKPLNVGQKISLGYALALGIAVFGTAIGSVVGYSYQQLARRLLEDALEETILVDIIHIELVHTRLHQQKLMSVIQQPETLKQESRLLQNHYAEFDRVWSELVQSYEEPEVGEYESYRGGELGEYEEELEAYEDLVKIYEILGTRYFQKIETLGERFEDGYLSPEEVETARKEIQSLDDSVVQDQLYRFSEGLDRLRKLVAEEEEEATENLERTELHWVQIIAGSLTLSVAIAAILAFYTSRAIANPIKNVTATAQQVTQESNFDLQVPISTQDEIGVLAIAFNQLIQRVKHAIEALKTAKQAADTANTAKSEFLANMSHELRTPLNAILGFTQILQRSDTSPTQQREYIDIIHRSGEHLLALINDILEMSKIEAGRISLNPNNFDLYRLLDTLEEMFDLRAQSKGLQLLFERSGEVPQYICTDENKLRQVLINLLGNAIKFTPEGGVVLRVGMGSRDGETGGEGSRGAGEGRGAMLAPEAREEGKSGEPVGAGLANHSSEQRVADRQNRPSPEFIDPGQMTLHFEVEDSGMGIAPEDIDSIFKAFSQTESGLQSQEGTGLGLPISRKFVELLGGELKVNSTLNRGSTFHFTLPVTVVSADEVEDALPTRRVVGLAPGQAVPRILAVEDNPINRKLLAQVLTNVGLEVRQASNGQEAIEIWREWQPHLIWMDMRMPVMDGYQSTQIIKAEPKGKKTAIVALTASAMEEDRVAILSSGCDGFVRKPFQEAEIFAAMEKFLGLRYVYEDSAPGSEKDEEAVSSTLGTLQGQIEQMPSQWLTQLEDAAIQGLDDRIFELVEEMPAEGNELAQRLREWARDFEFDRILELFQSTPE